MMVSRLAIQREESVFLRDSRFMEGFLCALCGILGELGGQRFCLCQTANEIQVLTAKFAKDSAKGAKTSWIRTLLGTR